MKTANEIIDSLGGTSSVAELCNVTTGAVSQWRENGIPKPWVRFFECSYPELFDSSTSDCASKAA